jgi:hypothetical protein
MEDLGGLALALEQAGAYISQRRLSLAAYRSQWQSSREQVLPWSDAQLMQYDRSLATTWLTSYRAVSDGARTLLRRLAWLSPEPIPESLLEVAVPADEDVHTGGWEALVELEGWSLVNRSGEAPLFTVHRLVQEVSRLWQQQPPPRPRAGGPGSQRAGGHPGLDQCGVCRGSAGCAQLACAGAPGAPCSGSGLACLSIMYPGPHRKAVLFPGAIA